MIERCNLEVTAIDKKFIQKKRIVKYFIDAVKQIEAEEGLNAVTIRKVADIAGYNSATLYNYFENLDHLLLFASMDYFRDYVSELPEKLRGINDPIERYIAIAECFYRNGFKYPENFYAIFFAKVSNSINHYIKEYYELFPIAVGEMDHDIREIADGKDLFYRDSISMKKCIEDDYFTKEDGLELNEIMVYVFESFLYRVIHDQLDSEYANQKIVKYLHNMIQKYRKK